MVCLSFSYSRDRQDIYKYPKILETQKLLRTETDLCIELMASQKRLLGMAQTVKALFVHSLTVESVRQLNSINFSKTKDLNLNSCKRGIVDLGNVVQIFISSVKLDM